MANKRSEPVSYRPFRADPVFAEGLLGVARDGGELYQRVAAGLFRIAAQAGERADRQAARQGAAAGQRAALDGRPQADVTGGAGEIGDVEEMTPDRVTRGIKGDVRQVISEAATRHGVSPAALLKIAMIESSGNPNAKNPRSSAGGLFQFIDSTAKSYGLKNRFDPAQAADAAARLAKDNAAHLRKVLGRDPTDGELYLAHQQGAGGAARLLKNPSASAESVVGEAAVRLNGGKPGMTAGQFASLWTRKAGGRAPAGTDPVTTAGSDAPPQISVSGGGFRPTGRDTIRGRAYDEAGVKTFVQLLDAEMRSTTSQLFDRYKDDPAGLETAFGDLKGQLKKDHTFAEIEADFEVGFDSLAGRYLDQARSNALAKQEAADRATFIERTASLETDQQQRLADFDPKSEAAADSIAATQQAIDEHYDSAVARGIMDPDDAAKAKIASRREAALGFYGKQADTLDADGVKSMREEMRKDFAEGGIDGLDGAAWSTLDSELERLEAAKRNEQQRDEAEFRERGDSQAARVAAGFDVDQAEMARLALDAAAKPDGKKAMLETYAKISAGKAIRDMRVSQGRAHVAGLRKQYGENATDAELRTLAFAEGMLDAKRKAIANDSVSYAETQGLVPETPRLTDAPDAATMQDTMKARVAAAGQAASALETSVRYLKEGEAKALGDAIRKDPASGIAIAGAIVAGAGDAAGRVLAEFGDDAPMIAEAGAIMSIGGSARAAEDVILGYGKTPDGKPYKDIKPAAAQASFEDVAGDALALWPKDGERVKRAAAAIARKRIADAGLEPNSDAALEIHAQAVQEAAGARYDRGVQFGGFADFDRPGWFSGAQKIIIPSSIRADAFADLVGALTDEDLALMKVKPKPGANPWNLLTGRTEQGLAATILAGVPVAVAGGYGFALGDPAGDDPRFIQGEDGGIFVLDLLSLRERLETRVPGAFR